LDAVANAFAIWDTEEKRWVSRGTRTTWCSRSGAANAWNADQKRGWGKPPIRFSNQTRYVTKEVRFVAVEEDL
jgi:hypothetical protein